MDKMVRDGLDLSLKKGVTADLMAAVRATDRKPSPAKAKAGTYKKGRFDLDGLTVVIETPKGVARTGTTPDGRDWSVKMPAHYGYVLRTKGADGDHVDVYIGPRPASSDQVFIVDQLDLFTGGFDEHKCIIGCGDLIEAIQLYDAGFSDGKGPDRRGAITSMHWSAFKDWLMACDTTVPVSTGVVRLEKAERVAASIAAQYQNRIATGVASFFSWLLGDPADAIAEAAANTNSPADTAAVLVESDVRDRFTQAVRGIDSAFLASAKQSANSNLPPPGDKTLAFSFDQRDARSQLAIDGIKGELVQAIDEKQRQAIQIAVSEAVARGEPPDRMARQIKQVIGLTPSQAEQVGNYRRELESLDRNALNRTLRDGRYDGVVDRAINQGAPLTDDQIDRMVGSYQRRYIARRAENIARTESLRAVNQGQFDAIRQAVEGGEYGDVEIEKIWIATKDNRTRDTHRELDGKVVKGLDAVFITTKGNALRHPHDPAAPGDETINCRCTMAIRLVPRSGGDLI